MPFNPSQGSPLIVQLEADLNTRLGGDVTIRLPPQSSLGDIYATVYRNGKPLFDFQVRQDPMGGLHYGGTSVLPEAGESQYDWVLGRLMQGIGQHNATGPGPATGPFHWSGNSMRQATYLDPARPYNLGELGRLSSQRSFPGYEDPAQPGVQQHPAFSRSSLIEHPEAFRGEAGEFYASRDRSNRHGFDTSDMVYQGRIARRNALTGEAEYMNFKEDGSAGKFVKHSQVSGMRDVAEGIYLQGGLRPPRIGLEMRQEAMLGQGEYGPAGFLPTGPQRQRFNILFDPSQPAGMGTNYGVPIGIQRESTRIERGFPRAFDEKNFYMGTIRGRYQHVPGLGSTSSWDETEVGAANIVRTDFHAIAQIPIKQRVGTGNYGLFNQGSKVFIGAHRRDYGMAPSGQTGFAVNPADFFKNPIAAWQGILTAAASDRGGFDAIGAPDVLAEGTLPQFKAAAHRLVESPDYWFANRKGQPVFQPPSAANLSRSGAWQWGDPRLPMEQALRLKANDPSTYNTLVRQSAHRQGVYGEIIRAGHVMSGETVRNRPQIDVDALPLQTAWAAARQGLQDGQEADHGTFLGALEEMYSFMGLPKQAQNRPMNLTWKGRDGAAGGSLPLPSLRNLRFALAGELFDEADEGYDQLKPIHATYARSALEILMARGAGIEESSALRERYAGSVMEMYGSPATAKRYTSLYPEQAIGAPSTAPAGVDEIPLNERRLGDNQLMRMFRLQNAAELDQMKAWLGKNPVAVNTFRQPNTSDVNMLRLRLLPSNTPDDNLSNKLIQSMSVGDFDPDHAIAYVAGQVQISRGAGGLTISGKNLVAPMSESAVRDRFKQMNANMAGLGAAEYRKMTEDAAAWGYDYQTGRYDPAKMRAALHANIDKMGSGGWISASGVQGALGERLEFKNRMGQAYDYGRTLSLLSGGDDRYAQMVLPAYQKALDEKMFSASLQNFFDVQGKLQPATGWMRPEPGSDEFKGFTGRWDQRGHGARNSAMLSAMTSLMGAEEFADKDFLVPLMVSDPEKQKLLRAGLDRAMAITDPEARAKRLSMEVAMVLGPKSWDEAGTLGVVPTAMRAMVSKRWNEEKLPMQGVDLLWSQFGTKLHNTVGFMKGNVTAANMKNMIVPAHMADYVTRLSQSSGLNMPLADDDPGSNTMDAWAQRVGFGMPSFLNKALGGEGQSRDRNIIAEIMPEEAKLLRGLEEIGKQNPSQARQIFQILASAGGGGMHGGLPKFQNPALSNAAFDFFGGDAVWGSEDRRDELHGLTGRAFAYMRGRGAQQGDYDAFASRLNGIFGPKGLEVFEGGAGWGVRSSAPAASGGGGPSMGAGAGGVGSPPPPVAPPPGATMPGGGDDEFKRLFAKNAAGFFDSMIAMAPRIMRERKTQRDASQTDFGSSMGPAFMHGLRNYLETGSLDEISMLGSTGPGPGMRGAVGQHAFFSSFEKLETARLQPGKGTIGGALEGIRNLHQAAAANWKYLDRSSDDFKYFTGGAAITDFTDLQNRTQTGYEDYAARKAMGGGGGSRAGGLGAGAPGSTDQLSLLQRGFAGLDKTMEALTSRIEKLNSGAVTGAGNIRDLTEEIQKIDKVKDAFLSTIGRAQGADADSAMILEAAKGAGITDPSRLARLGRAPYANRTQELLSAEMGLGDATDKQDWFTRLSQGKGTMGRILGGGQFMNSIGLAYLSRLDRLFVDPALNAALEGGQDEFETQRLAARSGYAQGSPGSSQAASGAFLGYQAVAQRQAAATWSPAVAGASNLMAGGAGGGASILGPAVGAGLIGAYFGAQMGGPGMALALGVGAGSATALTGIFSRGQYLADNPDYAAVEQARTAHALDNPWAAGAMAALGISPRMAISGIAGGGDPNQLVPRGQNLLGIANAGAPRAQMQGLSAAGRSSVFRAQVERLTKLYGNEEMGQQTALGSQIFYGGGVRGEYFANQFLMAGADMGQLSALSQSMGYNGQTGSLAPWEGMLGMPNASDAIPLAQAGLGGEYGQSLAQMNAPLSPMQGYAYQTMSPKARTTWGNLASRARTQEQRYSTAGLNVPGLGGWIEHLRGQNDAPWAVRMLDSQSQRYDTAVAFKDWAVGMGMAPSVGQGMMNTLSGVPGEMLGQSNLMAQGVMSGNANVLSQIGSMPGGDISMITRETGRWGGSPGLGLFTSTMGYGNLSPGTVINRMFGNNISGGARAALLGNGPTMGNQTAAGGMWGLQQYMSNLQYQGSMASAGFAIAGVNRSLAMQTGEGIAGYNGINLYEGKPLPWSTTGAVGGPFREGRGLWAIQDDQEKLQRTQARWQFEQGGSQRDMNLNQFLERWDFNRNDQMRQFQWQQEDFGFRASQMRTQRNFQTEDWSFNRNMRQMNFGWQMEDFDENIRYATGRDRRHLERDRGRATEVNNIEEGRASTMERRQREMWKMEDSRFDVEKKRSQELHKIALDRMDMEKRHFMERLGLEDKAREQQRAWLDEQEKLEDEARQIQRAFWKEGEEQQKAAAGAQAGIAAKLKEANDIQFEINKKIERQTSALRRRQDSEINFYENLTGMFNAWIGWVKSGGNGYMPGVPDSVKGVQGDGDDDGVADNAPHAAGGQFMVTRPMRLKGTNHTVGEVTSEFVDIHPLGPPRKGIANFSEAMRGGQGGGLTVIVKLDGKEISYELEEGVLANLPSRLFGESRR